MSDYSADYKQEMVKNYISNIDFNGDFSIKKIKEDLKKYIGETPGIDVQWRKEDIIVEKSGMKTNTVSEAVKSITVAFSDGEYSNGMSKIYKVSHYV